MNIIYGICGIGNGHTYRQEPLIERLLAQGHRLCIFAYGNSLAFYQKKYANHPQVQCFQVAVSFIPGNTEKQLGLDFEMAQHIHHDGEHLYLNVDKNKDNKDNAIPDYLDINLKAMAEAQNWLGKPDLCISDYEPISAQYAYAYSAPVITFDQQSKYLSESHNFPGELNGISHLDEVMRLNMFFPKAHKRIACSFFNLKHQRDDLLLIAPALSKKFINTPSEDKHYVLYLSSQNGYSQSLADILTLFHQRQHTGNDEKINNSSQEYFHVFLPDYILGQLDDIEARINDTQTHEQQMIHSPINYDNLHNHLPLCQHGNVFFYSHGSTAFTDLLRYCHGVISTAGHTLLSECMAMNIPVYALPINVYEQQLNAWMIHEHGFGLMENSITQSGLAQFIANSEQYRHNIIADKQKASWQDRQHHAHSNDDISLNMNINIKINKPDDSQYGVLLHHPDSLELVMQEINRFNPDVMPNKK